MYYDTSKKMFWRVGDNVHYSKMDALTESAKTGNPVNFHLFDDEFDTYDWTIEPTETWDEILRQRAQQLRDSYQYIRLWYSGGADSHTILLTFLKHGIFIDEILMMRHSPYGNFLEKTEREINEVAIPFIQSIQNQIPNTKITVFDVGPNEYEKFSGIDFRESGCFKFKPFSFRELYMLAPKALDIQKEGQTRCEIRGHEKPRVFMEDGKFYSALYDGSFNLVSFGDYYLETFFTTGSMPKVHIKQAHILKNHLKTKYNIKTTEELDILTKKYYSSKQHINECCRYPLWKLVTIGKGPKPGAMAYKEELTLEVAKEHNYKVYDRFMSFVRNEEGSGLQELCNDKNLLGGFLGSLSKKYYLGE